GRRNATKMTSSPITARSFGSKRSRKAAHGRLLSCPMLWSNGATPLLTNSPLDMKRVTSQRSTRETLLAGEDGGAADLNESERGFDVIGSERTKSGHAERGVEVPRVFAKAE